MKLEKRSDVYPFIDPARFEGSLDGKVALVTGAGRGIGRSIAMAFARAGAHVACVSRTLPEINEVVDEINAAGYLKAIGIRADVASDNGPRDVVAQVEKAFGLIDILVNNAGIDRIGAFRHEEDFASWWRVMEINMKAPAALTHAVLPGMVSRGSGAVIHIGSRNGIYNFPYMTAYSASKTALLRFCQCLHLELEGTGVRTFYLQPGDVKTKLMKDSFRTEELSKEPRLNEMIQGMQGRMDAEEADSPELAANACVALAAHPDAHHVSGLYVDANQDLGQMIEDIKKGDGSQIQTHELYSLKANLL